MSRYAASDCVGGLIRFENGVGLQVKSFWASHQRNQSVQASLCHGLIVQKVIETLLKSADMEQKSWLDS